MGRFAKILILLLLLIAMVFSVSAVSADNIDSYGTVSRNGDCQVTMTVLLNLDAVQEEMTFPVPREATTVTVNGRRVSTQKTDTARHIDLDRFVKGMTGDFTISISYTLPDVVHTNEDRILEMELPLLAGFAYPVKGMDFSVTLPGPTTQKPTFESGYHKADIEKHLHYTVNGANISGYFLQELKDHETLVMRLTVDSEMFPQTLADIQDYTFGIWGMGICGILALLYWLVCLAFFPIRFRRSTEPPLSATAGELGCILHNRGADLHLTVLTWAQLGYVVIEYTRQGKVYLHKRMEMGNERGMSEQQLFRKLFARQTRVDTDSRAYAALCQLAEKKPGLARDMIHPRSGNNNLFRALAGGMGLFGGVCIAIALGSGAVLQGLLILALGLLGALSGWYIQRIGTCLLTPNRFKLIVCLSLCALWLLLGLISGAFQVAMWMVLGLVAAGLFLSWGGRRTALGRETYGQILGLGWHMCRVEPAYLQEGASDYFYRLLPYALAMGVDKVFAKRFGDIPMESCPYVISRETGTMTALEQIPHMRSLLERMDQRSRRLPLEQLIAFCRRLFKR